MKRKSLSIVAVILVTCLALLFTSAILFGRGGRGQFSPDTLQSRTQTEYLIPLTEIAIYRGHWRESRWPIVDYLMVNGYWSAAEMPEPRWIETFEWNKQWRDGESTLYRELVWHYDDWIQWTKEHPDLAKVVWPRVLRQLREPPTRDQLPAHAVLMAAKMSNTLEEFNALLKE